MYRSLWLFLKKNMRELDKTYNAAIFEDSIYKAWEESGYFNPDNLKTAKEPFTISMPPPNATGTLHTGHAMMLVLQDLMIRFNRMRGRKALWVPGTDHASIATQNKVEKQMLKEGLTRHDLPREDFIKRIETYVDESRVTIRNQIRKMGSSCDWSRERYTLDEGLSHAVKTIFIRMHADGLIYRGNRIVNWCPRCKSTLADDEVIYKEEKTPFYYFKYGPVVIGTVRPETKFLDKTIVVHPDDARYKHLTGQEFDVEWITGPVRAHVVADTVADMNFGSGVMTITPGHSFEDFDLAQKYHLAVEKVIDEDGNFTAAAGSFAGKNARESRAAIIDILRKKGLVDHVDENYTHNLSVCYRCGTPVDPLPSLQWFVDVNKKIPNREQKSLKEIALESVQSGRITIVPKSFEKRYFQWMNNLHDWCISRQIVFGHRLPVYYCGKKNGGCGEVIVAHEAPTECPSCKNTALHHDEDTLDTWFSSGLWTFSTLGWPDNAEEKHGKIIKKGDLAMFHPTSVMETGYDILPLWVARMIMMSEYALHEEPFKTVYLHGLVLDINRKKMSKSNEETLIDPLDVIPKYGADALRISMLVGVTPGNDLLIGEEKIASYRNFINKLWNISRFILQFGMDEKVEKKHTATLADRWIFSRLARTIESVTHHIETFRFASAAEELRVFTWDELADWYLEIAKVEKGKHDNLFAILEKLLALWHPFTPFATEVLYQHIRENIHPQKKSDKEQHPTTLMIHPWPAVDKKMVDEVAEKNFVLIKMIIQSIRNARAEHNIPPSQKIQGLVWTQKHRTLITDSAEIIKRLARLDFLEFVQTGEKPHNAVFLKISDDLEVYLPLGMRTGEEEQIKLQKEIARLQGLITDLNTRLTNQEFVQRAPKHIIQKETEKRDNYIKTIEKLEEQLKKIS
jgi:valyl-tRNA synthetase